MKDQGIQYDVTEFNDEPGTVNYLFVSESCYSENAIVKVIQYTQILQSNELLKYYNGKLMYNLGLVTSIHQLRKVTI